MADRKTTAIGITALLAIAILSGFALYRLFLVMKEAASFVNDLNPTILAAVIVGSLTVVGSVAVASYSARRAQERVAQQANIGRKAEVYEEFMEFLVDIMKAEKGTERPSSDKSQEFFYKFATKVTIYGGPRVVKAFLDWRDVAANCDDRNLAHLEHFEKFVRAMREDLGESNKGIAKNGFLGIFVVGGTSEIARELQRDPKS